MVQGQGWGRTDYLIFLAVFCMPGGDVRDWPAGEQLGLRVVRGRMVLDGCRRYELGRVRGVRDRQVLSVVQRRTGESWGTDTFITMHDHASSVAGSSWSSPSPVHTRCFSATHSMPS